ncbi:MAG TPA: hypothetical protein VGX48_24760 [Pyrinomonadaceae bacterium]|jgi:hypothetical protein|nr:hypothetical protein [Pyrinomonadaceae bacterium]
MSANLNTSSEAGTTLGAARFPLGRLFLTPGAIESLEDAGQSPQEFIDRHARLEQGELCDEDHKENLFSVDKPLRIFSAFKTMRGEKLWVITEADRSATTILLPEEY